MIKYYYKSLRTARMGDLPTPKRGTWVYAEAPSHKDLEMLAEKYDLELDLLQDALDEDEMPRLDKEKNASYIFVRFAYTRADGEIDTAPLLFVFAKEVVITISLTRLPLLDKFLSGKLDVATTQRTKLVLQIMQEIVNQYDVYITGTSKKIKLIRSRLRGHEVTNQDFLDFVLIEDELNEFLSALQPTNSTLRRLQNGRYMPLFDEDKDLVEDLLLDNEQSIEACSSNIKSIVGIRDAHSSISANSLNRTMKILAVATIGITIPNVFFGLYSMNVTIPLQHWLPIFWFVIGFTIFVTALVLVVGRRKRIF